MQVHERLALPVRVRSYAIDDTLDLLAEGPPVKVHEQSSLTLDMSGLPEGSRVMLGDYEIVVPTLTDPIKPFRNTIGISAVRVEVPDSVLAGRAFDVYGSKATVTRAKRFLIYLKDNADDVSQLCFSTTRQASDSSASSVEIINRKLDAGIKALEYFEQSRLRFATHPAYQSETKSHVRPYSRDMEMTEEAVTYLAMNPHAVTQTTAASSHFSLHGRHYAIDHTLQRQLHRDTDVYENRVIHAFLQHFAQFLEVAEKLSQQKHRVNAQEVTYLGDDCFSFDSLMEQSGLAFGINERRIQMLRKRLLNVQRAASEAIPVSTTFGAEGMPVPTSRVLNKSHYVELYRFLLDYHQAGEPQWVGATDFFGLRSLPKVYEFVCLYLLLSELVNKGGFVLSEVEYVDFTAPNEPPADRPANQPHNVYRLTNGEVSVTLYYEPILKPARMSEATRLPIVDAVHTHILRNGQPCTWPPDFVLEVRGRNGESRVHVMDAKYSDASNVIEGGRFARRGHLADCLLKYQVGILRSDGRGAIDSMHILFSDLNARDYQSHYSSAVAWLGKAGQRQPGPPIFPNAGAIVVDASRTAALSQVMAIISGTR